MTLQQEQTQHLVDEIRENLDRIEALAKNSELGFFKPSETARLRALAKRLTMRVETL